MSFTQRTPSADSKMLTDRIFEAEVYFKKINGFLQSSKIHVPSILDIYIRHKLRLLQRVVATAYFYFTTSPIGTSRSASVLSSNFLSEI